MGSPDRALLREAERLLSLVTDDEVIYFPDVGIEAKLKFHIHEGSSSSQPGYAASGGASASYYGDVEHEQQPLHSGGQQHVGTDGAQRHQLRQGYPYPQLRTQSAPSNVVEIDAEVEESRMISPPPHQQHQQRQMGAPPLEAEPESAHSEGFDNSNGAAENCTNSVVGPQSAASAPTAGTEPAFPLGPPATSGRASPTASMCGKAAGKRPRATAEGESSTFYGPSREHQFLWNYQYGGSLPSDARGPHAQAAAAQGAHAAASRSHFYHMSKRHRGPTNRYARGDKDNGAGAGPARIPTPDQHDFNYQSTTHGFEGAVAPAAPGVHEGGGGGPSTPSASMHHVDPSGSSRFHGYGRRFPPQHQQQDQHKNSAPTYYPFPHYWPRARAPPRHHQFYQRNAARPHGRAGADLFQQLNYSWQDYGGYAGGGNGSQSPTSRAGGAKGRPPSRGHFGGPNEPPNWGGWPAQAHNPWHSKGGDLQRQHGYVYDHDNYGAANHFYQAGGVLYEQSDFYHGYNTYATPTSGAHSYYNRGGGGMAPPSGGYYGHGYNPAGGKGPPFGRERTVSNMTWHGGVDYRKFNPAEHDRWTHLQPHCSTASPAPAQSESKADHRLATPAPLRDNDRGRERQGRVATVRRGQEKPQKVDENAHQGQHVQDVVKVEVDAEKNEKNFEMPKSSPAASATTPTTDPIRRSATAVLTSAREAEDADNVKDKKRLEFVSYDENRRCFYYRVNYDVVSEIDRLEELLTAVGTAAVGGGSTAAGGTTSRTTAPAAAPPLAPTAAPGAPAARTIISAAAAASPSERAKMERKRHLVRFLTATAGTLGSFGVSGNGVFELSLYSEGTPTVSSVSGDESTSSLEINSKLCSETKVENKDESRDKKIVAASSNGEEDHDPAPRMEPLETSSEDEENNKKSASGCSGTSSCVADDHASATSVAEPAPEEEPPTTSSPARAVEEEQEPPTTSSPAAVEGGVVAEVVVEDAAKGHHHGHHAAQHRGRSRTGSIAQLAETPPADAEQRTTRAASRRRRKNRNGATSSFVDEEDHFSSTSGGGPGPQQGQEASDAGPMMVKLRSFSSELCTRAETFPLFARAAYISVTLLAAFPKPLTVDSTLFKNDCRGNVASYVRRLLLFNQKAVAAAQQASSCSGATSSASGPAAGAPVRLHQQLEDEPGDQAVKYEPSSAAELTGNRATWDVWVRPDVELSDPSTSSCTPPTPTPPDMIDGKSEERATSCTSAASQHRIQLTSSKFHLQGVAGAMQILFYPRGEPRAGGIGGGLVPGRLNLLGGPLAGTGSSGGIPSKGGAGGGFVGGRGGGGGGILGPSGLTPGGHSPFTRKIFPQDESPSPTAMVRRESCIKGDNTSGSECSDDHASSLLTLEEHDEDQFHPGASPSFGADEADPASAAASASPPTSRSPNVSSAPRKPRKTGARGTSGGCSTSSKPPVRGSNGKKHSAVADNRLLARPDHRRRSSKQSVVSHRTNGSLVPSPTGYYNRRATSSSSKNALNGRQSRSKSPNNFWNNGLNPCSCALFLRAPGGTRHAFSMRVNDTVRCAAHFWDRESNWGFPVFCEGPSDSVTIQVEALAPIPPVVVQNRVADWVLDSSLFEKKHFQPGEEIRSEPFKIGSYELQLFLYPQGSGSDSDYISLFLKYAGSVALTCHVTLDGIGPRGLCHDGNGIWGYPTFCPRSFLAPYLDGDGSSGEDDAVGGDDGDAVRGADPDDDTEAARTPEKGAEDDRTGGAEIFVENQDEIESETGDKNCKNRRGRGGRPAGGSTLRAQLTQNPCTKRMTHLVRVRVEVITAADRRGGDDFDRAEVVLSSSSTNKTNDGEDDVNLNANDTLGDVAMEIASKSRNKGLSHREKVQEDVEGAPSLGARNAANAAKNNSRVPPPPPASAVVTATCTPPPRVVTAADREKAGSKITAGKHGGSTKSNTGRSSPSAPRPRPPRGEREDTEIDPQDHHRVASRTAINLPTRLFISKTLCEICDLPAPLAVAPLSSCSEKRDCRAMLWLGGDGASASRFLLAYYLNQLGCRLLYAPMEQRDLLHVVHDEDPQVDQHLDPDFDVIAVTTGDDELLYLQDAFAARPECNRRNAVRNDPATTSFRQHKFLQRLRCEYPQGMADYLAHFRGRKFPRSTDAQPLLSDIKPPDFKLVPLHEPTLRQEIDAYPVVLKIPYSDSSCGVVVVNSASELPDCIASTLGPASVWDPEKLPPEESAMSSNDEYGTSLRYAYAVPRLVIIEPLLVGAEFVVNTVSCDGVHVVSDAWVSTVKTVDETTKRPLYNTQELCAELPEDVLEFSRRALNRCGVKFGASHLELIRCEPKMNSGGTGTKKNEVRLIELNARLAGDFPRAQNFFRFFGVEESKFLQEYGVNQFSLLALAIAEPEQFLRFAKANQQPLKVLDPSTTVRAVFLLSDSDGKFSGRALAELCALQTFTGLRRALGHLPVPPQMHPLRMILNKQKEQNHDHLQERVEVEFPEFLGSTKKTVSLRSCPGVLLLAGDKSKVDADTDSIRQMERSGRLYVATTTEVSRQGSPNNNELD